jgi:hypothetical protein
MSALPEPNRSYNSSGINTMRRIAAVVLLLAAGTTLTAQQSTDPRQNKVDSPTVKVLTGLNVHDFEQEMQLFVLAIGVGCGGCHAGRGNFASDENPRKVKARQMIEMVKTINKQYFPTYTPAEGESVLGRVTCYTCHQGDAKPKSAP